MSSLLVKTFGVGKYTSRLNGEKTKYYTAWLSLHQRCYNKDYQIKNPTYKGVTVCEEWFNFQYFAEWYEKNYIEGFHLDKDIICNDCKIYSPETCCFVPQEINSLFTKGKAKRGIFYIGVTKFRGAFRVHLSKNGIQEWIGTFPTEKSAFDYYKQEKEKYIKVVAKKWKSKIDSKIYDAMINYKVKEND
jgi:hypothetical protein